VEVAGGHPFPQLVVEAAVEVVAAEEAVVAEEAAARPHP
jgi:hypothetical protein